MTAPSYEQLVALVAAHSGEALGRSRGGLTTKLHLAADGRGRPLTIALTEGQAVDKLPRSRAPGCLRGWRP